MEIANDADLRVRAPNGKSDDKPQEQKLTETHSLPINNSKNTTPMPGSVIKRIEHPALKRLIGDVEAGKIDAITVYKLDLLSRSLLDFTKLIALQRYLYCRLG
ncbi:MAG: recombinase family protein [Desulfobacterales bacterium]|nr:recombinase family protein [Desulfobacterales bacterium]